MTFPNHLHITEISTLGFDQPTRAEVKALLSFGSLTDVVVRFPAGNERIIPCDELHAVCLEVISGSFPDWPSLIPERMDVLSAQQSYLRQSRSSDLELIVSLFLLALELLQVAHKHPELSESKYLVERIFHKRLQDLLPSSSRNPYLHSIFVPSEDIQKRILSEDKDGRLYRLGRLCKCCVKDQQQSLSFHFRPFHTPVVGLWLLGGLFGLNDDLKDEYSRLLG